MKRFHGRIAPSPPTPISPPSVEIPADLIEQDPFGPFFSRLGLAFCRLNKYQWDELFGPEPESSNKKEAELKKQKISALVNLIERFLGSTMTNWYWAKYELGKDFGTWLQMYAEMLEEFKRRRT